MRGAVRNRRLGFQALEKRNLLAAYISELLVDPLFGNNDKVQMVELRGDPGAQLADNTYLVVVEEHRFDEGKIHGIFDLSGLQFGSNGYLVLLQHDSPHQPHADSNVLESTSTAFSGLPGEIYTDSHPISDRIDFIIGANGYLLIESSVPPQLDQDIDAENDGIIDSNFADNWTILDSISLHPFVGRGEIAYGDIVFAEIGTGPAEIDVPEGVALVHTEGFGYAGRVGASIGSDPSDWVAGTVQDESGLNEPVRWALVDNLFGVPSQYPFSGRDLDHVGEDNFVGGVRGVVESTLPEVSAEGVTILADTNGNGERDSLTFVVEPDDVIDPLNPDDDYPLINAYPGVTITNFALDSFPAHEVTAEQERDFPATLQNRIFAKGGISWFSNGGVLRFDFYRPVNSVSIVAIGSDNPLSEVYGRIDAFNEDGELIATTRSSLLIDSQRESITVSSGADDIAYVYAYSDENHLDGGPFGRFDHMVYSQLEPAATTDENGHYEIKHLFPGRYEISPLSSGNSSPPRVIDVVKYENFVQNFTFTPNDPPDASDAQFEIAENAAPHSLVGTITASDPESQPLAFHLQDPTGGHGFVIDESTGEITVGEGFELNAESVSRYEFDVVVRDPRGATDVATVTIDVSDVNEVPELESTTFTIAESAEPGALVGTVVGSDPDTLINQTLTYEIIGGNQADTFQIDSQSGAITLIGGLDFELTQQYELEIQVSDGGIPDLSATATATILIANENEAPIVEETTLEVSEAAQPLDVVGTIVASDPDAGQQLEFSIAGGNGAELFDISNSGTVTVAADAVLDFESDDPLTLVIDVSDNGTPALTTTVEVNVQVIDVNESPTIETSSLSVREDAALDEEVGVVIAGDPDANQLLTYQIVGGSGASVLAIDESSGLLIVADPDLLDHETDPELTLEVEVTDNGDPGLSATATLTIEVTDVNEAPVVITEQIEVDENSTGELAIIEVEDPDAAQSHTFEVVGGTGSDLVTVSETGVVSLPPDGVLDFESGDTYTLEVRVTDSGNAPLSIVASITIVIADVDEPPEFLAQLEPPGATTGEQFNFEIPADSIVDPEGNEVTVDVTTEEGELPSWLDFDPTTLVFSGIPSSMFAGPVELTLHAFDTETPDLFSTVQVELVVQVSETPLHNNVKPHDVNDDKQVTASDALRIINFLRRDDSGDEIESTVRFPLFYDVSGDNFVTALDALQVINEMSRNSLKQGSQNSEQVTARFDADHRARDEAWRQYWNDSTLF